jgi:hypothetical protein
MISFRAFSPLLASCHKQQILIKSEANLHQQQWQTLPSATHATNPYRHPTSVITSKLRNTWRWSKGFFQSQRSTNASSASTRRASAKMSIITGKTYKCFHGCCSCQLQPKRESDGGEHHQAQQTIREKE